MKEQKIKEENIFQYKGFDISIGYDNSSSLYYGKIVSNSSVIGVVFREKEKTILNKKIRKAIDDYEDFQLKTTEAGFYKGSSEDIMYSIMIGIEGE